ncbi:MAG: transcription termination factor NusA [Bacteroidales bacterium]|jgi:N utilization substance protein A|nr:transcription termination factor NusA [Bacteroidales bacterium]
MDNRDLAPIFSEFKEYKNIDRETMMRILEDVFRSTLIKKFGSDDNFDIIVNIDKGDLQIFHYRECVPDEEVTDPNSQISYSDAIKIEPDFEVGEEVAEEIFMKDFGRREILSIRQALATKVQEYEKDNVYQKYKECIGEIVTGEVYQTWRKEIMVLDNDNIELILPKSEQIPADFYRKGETIRAVVSRVEMKNGNPVIILSRTSPAFLERLFEQEVPEFTDGLITTKKIVRVPGERAKIAVESYDDRIDPVGACVGMRGSRIHGIVRELKNENIDVINYSSNPSVYIQRALSPAKVTNIIINEKTKKADVYMKPDQVSLAIGKGGYNIKLAGKLTGYEIDVYRDTDIENEDVDLQEFHDEIDQWIIDALLEIGCDTAKSVLSLPVEDIMKRADLDEETVLEVKHILKEEFE